MARRIRSALFLLTFLNATVHAFWKDCMHASTGISPSKGAFHRIGGHELRLGLDLVGEKTRRVAGDRKHRNAGNPMTDGSQPLLTCDVWEHAYYTTTVMRGKIYWGVLEPGQLGLRDSIAGRIAFDSTGPAALAPPTTGYWQKTISP